MTGSSKDKRERLIKLLDEEVVLLAELERQTELQSRFLGVGDVDMLSDMLDKRQETIEKLDGLHQETEILMQSYMSPQSRDEELESRRAGIASGLQSVISRDNELQTSMKAVAAEYSKEIRKLSEGRRGLGGYKFIDDGHSGVFDKKM